MISAKVCTKCGIEKSFSEFSKGTGKYGFTSYCKACTAAQHRLRTCVNPRYNQKINLQSKYKMTLEDFDRLLAQQNGRCAICGTDQPRGYGSRFAVDHDHTTGVIRALLCNCCNIALGQMDDDPDRLEAAARYLRAFKRE